MWQQLLIGGLKGYQDRQNQLKDIESNVINQKYSNWTGQKGDFSSIAKSPMMDGLMKGLGAGMLADKEAAEAEADKQAQYLAQQKKEGEGYTWGGIGTPIAPSKSSSFAAIAQKAAPAVTTPQAPASPLQPNNTPMIFPEAGANPWLSMATQSPSQAARLPAQEQRSAPVDPTAKMRTAFWNAIPNNLPIKQGWN